MTPRRPAPLEPGHTAADELAWLIAELNYLTFVNARLRVVMIGAVVVNLTAAAFGVWQLVT